MDRKAPGRAAVALPLTPNPSPALGRGEAICSLNFNSFTALVGKVGLCDSKNLIVLIKLEPRFTILLFKCPEVITGQHIGVVSRQVEQASPVINVNIHAACPRREIEVQMRVVVRAALILESFIRLAEIGMSRSKTVIPERLLGAKIPELSATLYQMHHGLRAEA